MTIWAGRLQKTGAVLLILCAIAHLIGHAANAGKPGRNVPETRMLDLMTGYQIPEIGRSMQDLMDGFSLSFSVMFAALGLLAWSIGKRGLVVVTVAMLFESAIGLRYWFVAPNSFILAATLCFVISLFLSSKEEKA